MNIFFRSRGDRRNKNYGFSLVELMIAMLISLILIGGTISVFLSNQQTYRTKQQLDEAQEGFRFASQTIIRIVRQGTSFETNSTESRIRVRMDGAAGSGLRDCFGDEVTNQNVISTIELVDDTILCSVEPSSRAPQTLVRNVSSLSFRYSDGNNYWASELADYPLSAPNNSRTVAVQIEMIGSGLTSQFAATLRGATINQ